MLEKDPIIIVRDLLVSDWDNTNLPLAEEPEITSGWYDHGSASPQVTITNTDENAVASGLSGQTAGTGDGGVAQTRHGTIIVNCWSGTYEDMEGMGVNGEDLSPKDVSYKMAVEVHRIIQRYAAGVYGDNGQKLLYSLAASDSRRVVEDQSDPTIFRYEVVVEYLYHDRTPGSELVN